MKSFKRWFILLLTIQSFCAELNAFECPIESDIPDCKCERSDFNAIGIRVKCSNIKDTNSLVNQIQKFANKTLSPLKLSNVSINYFPRDIFKDVILSSLVISKSVFQSLGPKDLSEKSPFDYAEKTMMSFYVQNSQIEHWDWTFLSKLTSLRSLFLYKNKVNSFAGWTTISKLPVSDFGIANTNLTSLGNETFKHNKDLIYLSLGGNKLNTINRETFPRPAPKLKYLDLRSNNIASLPMDLFDEMPVLSFVELDDNKIMTFPEELTSPIWHQLRGFLFSKNPIHCDGQVLWILRCSVRKEGNPRNNDLSNLKCDSPPHLKGTKVIDLSESDLESDNRLDKK